MPTEAARRDDGGNGRPFVLILGLVVVYVVTARLGLLLALPPEYKATAVWPPSGIALAAVLVFGRRVWPGVWLGAFLANLWDFFRAAELSALAPHLGVSAGIALGSTLQAVAGAALLRRWAGGGDLLDSARRVFLFVGVTLSVCTIAASFGATSLYLGGFASALAVPSIWWTWWLGDATGILLFTPLVLAWCRRSSLSEGDAREATLVTVVSLGVGLLVFDWSEVETGVTPMAYLTIPLLVWAALRFGQRGATAGLVLVSGLAVWGTANGSGPFIRPTLNESLFLLQMFMGVVALTALVLAASIRERGLATEALRASERRYRALIQATPQVVWTVGGDGEDSSAWWSELTGQSETETASGGWLDAVHPDDRERARAARAHAFDSLTHYDTEYRVRTRSGEYRHFTVKGVPITDPNGVLVEWVGTLTDVTEKKLAEESLKESESRHTTLAAAVPGFLFSNRADGGSDYTSRRFYEYTGLPDGAANGHGWAEAVHPDDRDGMTAHLASCIREKKPFERQCRFRSVAGEYRWFLSRCVPQLDEHGNVNRWYGICTDIDDQKHAEEQLEVLNAELERRAEDRTAALRVSEERFKRLAGNAPVGIFETDADGNCLFVNARWCQMAGMSGEAAAGQGWVAALHPDDRARVFREWSTAAHAQREFTSEYRFRTPTDDVTWLSGSALALRDTAGAVVGYIGTVTDITEGKRVERAMVAQAALLRQFIKHSPAAIAMFDRDVRYVQASDRWLTDYHLGACDIIGRSHYEVFPDIPERWKAVHQRVLAGAVERCDEDPFPRADGSTVWLQWECRPWLAVDGEVGGLIMFTQVITQRKLAEVALRASEERFRVLFEQSSDAHLIFDESEGIIDCNNATIAMLRCENKRAVLALHPAVLSPEFQPDGRRSLEKCIEMDATARRHGYHRFDWLHRRMDGDVFPCEVTLTPVELRGRSVLLVVWHELTERKLAEDQTKASLREKEVLLKEIHHRVKNNLQIVSTLLDLQSDHTADPQALEMFQESRGRVKSMALIHERLYRSQDMARVNFTEYVRQLADDLYHTYKVSVGDIRLELDVDIPPLPIDIAIPCGLLLNELMSNCFKHAFNDAAEGCIRVALTSGADGINELVVADDGAGFPTGTDFRNTASFGMQLVNTLVDQLDGEIELATGRGTAFTIRFSNTKN